MVIKCLLVLRFKLFFDICFVYVLFNYWERIMNLLWLVMFIYECLFVKGKCVIDEEINLVV